MFTIKNYSKSYTKHEANIKKMLTGKYSEQYKKAIENVKHIQYNVYRDARYFMLERLNSEGVSLRTKKTYINSLFYKSLQTHLVDHNLPKTYATAFYLINYDEINEMMTDELKQYI